MPELPEVETTKRGLVKHVVGLTIRDVWTDLDTPDKRKADTIASTKHFPIFVKSVRGRKILSAQRRAKNILINLSGGKTILVHLKMTGHLLYGKYKYKKNINRFTPAEEGPLSDPFNRFIHVVFTLSNGNHLAFSDMRKFGKIVLLDTKEAHTGKHLVGLGPEPLDKKFTLKSFKERLLKKPSGKIKTVLMDQSVLVGIGNIYSDEILWRASVHPERTVRTLTKTETEKIFKDTIETLKKGISFGGDSMSDYRNIYGKPGKFQLHHEAYRRTGSKCRKKGCRGVIERKVVNGRSAHFCKVHQK
ncbi:MAG TPA: DNA-formamidopyrimidine glycosylase [Candidatus Paceibacterota bacterium]|nr:DNA-formamidopyrimidine glycosylase [Candidatus Paceibacterota bacterium]